MFTIRIVPNDKGNPPGKLADAELHFGPEAGPLAGLKLIGFSVWERRGGSGLTGRPLNVTFPARQYSVNGERRSFALLRPIVDANAQQTIRDAILRAYQEHVDGAGLAPAAGGSVEADGFRWAPDTTPAAAAASTCTTDRRF